MRLLAAITLILLPLSAAAATPVSTISGPEAATAAPSAPGASATAAASAKCDRFGQAQQASVLRDPSPRAQRLGELPPGSLQLTVDREIEGCHQPVVVRENIGGAAFGGR